MDLKFAMAAVICGFGLYALSPTAGAAASKASDPVEWRIVSTGTQSTGSARRFELLNEDVVPAQSRFRIELRSRENATIGVRIEGAEAKALYEGKATPRKSVILPDTGGWYSFGTAPGPREIVVLASTAGAKGAAVSRVKLFVLADDMLDLSADQRLFACAIRDRGHPSGGGPSAGGDGGGRGGVNKMRASASSADALAQALRGSKNLSPMMGLLDDLDTLVGPTIQSRGETEIAVFRKAAPAVVLIRAELRGGGTALGSGSILNNDGRILTNHHVVENARQVGVVFMPAEAADWKPLDDMEVHRARVEKLDPSRDLAVIKLLSPPPNLTTLPLGKLDSISVGSDVHAIGNPEGQGWTYTKGVVSQIRHNFAWRTASEAGGEPIRHRATVIQTQTPISPGNSGGPLLNNDGDMVGVNSFGSAQEHAQNLNFAISVADVKAFLASREATVSASPRPPATGSASGSGSNGDCGVGVRVVDRNNNGRPDAVLVDRDGDGRLDYVLLDEDENGTVDVKILDRDGDGRPDTWLIDRNGDQRVDAIGSDVDQDGEIDRIRRVS